MASKRENRVRIIRKICRLTQTELCKMVGCSQHTIALLETGKMRLSERLAEQLAVHTGVSKDWLLAEEFSLPPIAGRFPDQPFNMDVYHLARAAVLGIRDRPLDVVAYTSFVNDAVARIRASACGAYQKDEMIKLNFKLRYFVEDCQRQGWSSPDEPGLTEEEYKQELEKIRAAKEQKAQESPSEVKAHG